MIDLVEFDMLLLDQYRRLGILHCCGAAYALLFVIVRSKSSFF